MSVRLPRRRPRSTRCAGALVFIAALAAGAGSLHAQEQAGAPGAVELRWAADPEGGAPYVQADPAEPARVEGFEVEIAALLARALGRTPRFVTVAYASIDQSVARGDADLGLNGLEDTPGRRAAMAVTFPYYRFREVLSVRSADAGRFRTLEDLAGRRVGTLGGTMAYDMLTAAGARSGIQAVSYDDDMHPYTDLLIGRVDAVLLDNVIAERRQRQMAGVTIQPGTIATGQYVGVLAAGNAALRDRINTALLAGMRDGSLERILRKWRIWNDDQPALYARLMAVTPGVAGGGANTASGGAAAAPGATGPSDAGPIAGTGTWTATRRYLPTLVRAAGVTIVLSCLAMALAVALGVLIASGRVYGAAPLRLALTGYVELMRGTPILLQLFVIYYGLASAVRLPAFLAALAGLALNYAAYESEIYRSALEGVSTGQLEAARTLGFTERQILTLVRGPQAFRTALAPMTNDFVALLKDSSLVSVLTVVELTKQTQIFAANIGSWVIPGSLCAALYLVMSLPLSAAARRLERRWKAPTA